MSRRPYGMNNPNLSQSQIRDTMNCLRRKRMKTTIMDMKDKKNSARLSLVSRTGAEDDDRTQEEESGLEEHSRFVPFEHHKWIGLKPVSFARPRYDGRSKRFFGAPKYEKFKRQLRHGRLASFDRLAGLGYL